MAAVRSLSAANSWKNEAPAWGARIGTGVVYVLDPWNNSGADPLTVTAITLPKEQTHETAPIDRICSLYVFVRSNSVRVGNAGCKPEGTHWR